MGMSETFSSDFQAATQAHRERQYESAETIYRLILEQEPSHLDAQFMLGILAAQTDREDLAIELLSQVVLHDPNNFEANKWLAGVLTFKLRYRDALPHALKGVELRPTDYDARLKLATCYFGLDDFPSASQAFVEAIKINRLNPDAFYGLATSYLRMGEPYLARETLRDAVRLQPSAESLLKLGDVCLACEDPQEALLCANRVLAHYPTNVDGLILSARAYRNAQDEAHEDEALGKLRDIAPNHHLVLTLNGRRFQSLGQFQEAEEQFRKSITTKPDQGVAYYGITAGRRINDQDRLLVEQMEKSCSSQEVNADELAHLHFALGKAYDNLGDYGNAMSHFDEGNRLMRQLRMGNRKYDRQAASKHIDNIISFFTPEFMRHHAEKAVGLSDPHPVPIFIAGIMRSGTTLAEQILSCHSMVGGGGEQAFWRPAESECLNFEKRKIYRDVIKRKALAYTNLLAQVSPGFAYVTDKNPANRMVYGLLHLAFPGSKIIHMRRNPVDVAISIYTTLIRTGAPVIGDRDDIVFALKEHERLVDHWREILPDDSFLEVRYESLVQNREEETRRIVEFCRLPWDDSCLRPEDNLRTVVTPSFWQVRQPVYTGSLDRWRRYEPWLGSFSQLLP